MSTITNRPHGGPEEDRCSDANPARRRRPDRANPGSGESFLKDREERDVQGIQGCAARHVHHLEGQGQQRSARVYQKLTTTRRQGSPDEHPDRLV